MILKSYEINKINEKVPYEEIVNKLYENYKNEITLQESLEIVKSLVNEQNLKNI